MGVVAMTANQNATWVLTTDTNTCRIYGYSKKPAELILLKEIQHPENKLRDIDLTSSKPGRYKASGSANGAYSQPTDPKEIKIDAFSREIAKELDHGRTTNAYKNLMVIALPHMHGLLFQHINKHVKDLVTHMIEKDLHNLADHELLIFLQVNTKYASES
jgi:protein required for attachment to host cells